MRQFSKVLLAIDNAHTLQHTCHMGRWTTFMAPTWLSTWQVIAKVLHLNCLPAKHLSAGYTYLGCWHDVQLVLNILGLASHYVCDKIVSNDNDLSHNTRNASQLSQLKPLPLYLHLFLDSISGIVLLEKECNSVTNFKKSVKGIWWVNPSFNTLLYVFNDWWFSVIYNFVYMYIFLL